MTTDGGARTKGSAPGELRPRAGAISRRALDAAPDAVVVIDAGGEVVYANVMAERMFGFSAADVPGGRVQELFPPAGDPTGRMDLASALAELSDEVTVHRRELVAQRPDGTELPVELTVARASSEPPQFTAWIRDLSEEQAVRAEAERRDAMFAVAEMVAQSGSWEWTPEAEELRWSDNTFRIFGLEPGEIEPTLEYAYTVIHPDDRDYFARAVERLRRDGVFTPVHYRIVRADNTVRYLHARMALTSPGEGPRRFVGSVQDLTEQRRAEREISAHYAVSKALDEWGSLEQGAPGLLRGLAESLDFEVGVLWLPRGRLLEARVLWRSATVDAEGFEAATAELRFARGAGLPGRAWETAAPINVVDVQEHPDGERGAAAAAAGLRGALALPALHQGEALAVLEFHAREESVLTERLLRSLTGIGYELGEFLVHRRGELEPRSLTPREVEVLQLATQGHSRPKIAELLVVSPATVKTHFEHIYEKLGVSDRASAVAEALRLGLIE